MAKRARRSRTRLLALEPRLLFDGALADSIAALAAPVYSHAAEALYLSRFAPHAAAGALAGPRAAAAEATAAAAGRSEIIFLVTRVTNFQQLLDQVNRSGAWVVLLNLYGDAIDLGAQLGGGQLQHQRQVISLLTKPRKPAEQAGESLLLRQSGGERRAFAHGHRGIDRARTFNGFA